MYNKFVKRLFKLLISIIYFIINQPHLILLKVLNKKSPGTFVVLYYHEIKKDHKENFSRQMAILSKNTTPVKADSISFVEGERRVAVTFDDAFQSIIENGIEAINSYKIPVTIFVPTECLGKHPGWGLGGNLEISKEIIMTRSQLKNLSKELVMLGSHTCTHPNLTELSGEEIERELKKSKDDLEKLLSREIDLMAFPHGKYNDEIIRIAKSSGYRYVYTIMPEFPRQNLDNAIIGRTPANPYDWDLEFKLKIAGYYCWLSFPGDVKRFLRRVIFK